MTAEELEARLVEYTKEREWELNDWYEKFSTLHARIARRAKRDAAAVDQETPVIAGPPSDLELWSRVRAARGRT